MRPSEKEKEPSVRETEKTERNLLGDMHDQDVFGNPLPDQKLEIIAAQPYCQTEAENLSLD